MQLGHAIVPSAKADIAMAALTQTSRKNPERLTAGIR